MRLLRAGRDACLSMAEPGFFKGKNSDAPRLWPRGRINGGGRFSAPLSISGINASGVKGFSATPPLKK